MTRFLSEVAAIAQSTAIGWSIYERTHTPWSLGLVGLIQFIPVLLFTLPAGEICDRLSPRCVLATGLILQALCSCGLAIAVMTTGAIWPIYLVLLLSGIGRAFTDPANQALLPRLLPIGDLPRAIAWGSAAWQVAVIGGPLLGGAAYMLGARQAYLIYSSGFFLAAVTLAMLAGDRTPARVMRATMSDRLRRIGEGLRFVRTDPILLGALSLDLVTVLIGGTTALLPIYAREILHIGPLGLGLLRGAPALGACVVALFQIHRPSRRHLGLALLAAVAVFGGATLVFALSTSLTLSLAALTVVGGSDMISVNARSSILQMGTPDDLRGRVNAVNMVFVGASSELGTFESGALAAAIGSVAAVAIGGLGVLLASGVWLVLFPSLRKLDALESCPADGPDRV